MKKLLVIVGKSASGKSTILKELCENHGYTPIVSYTTRPKRDNEADGVDYHFTDLYTFYDMVNADAFIEWRCYHTLVQNRDEDWFYGISKDSLILENKPVVIVTLDGLEQLIDSIGRDNIFSVYVYSSASERLQRAIKRPNFDVTEWDRRLKADNNDFTFERIMDLCDITLENESLKKITKQIKQLQLMYELGY